VLEHESGGVQKRSIEMADGAQIARHASPDAAVQSIADNGVTDRAQMSPDLVRPACMNGDLYEREHT
jgi:hypothetical protein